jgi:hypothetical protein
MPRRALSLPFSLLLFVAGLLLCYYVLHTNRRNTDDVVTEWNNLAVLSRLTVVVGFGASVSGLGGIVNGLLPAAKRR